MFKYFKFLISFFLIFQVADAANFTYPDFTSNYKRIKKSFVYFKDLRAVALTNHLAVAYSPTKPKAKFVKYDPFLNLYLFYSKKTLKPVRLKNTKYIKIGEWLAGMNDTSMYVGNFAKTGDILDTLYLQNAQMEANSIVSCLCGEIYGLSIGSGSFIGSEYLKRFIKEKDIFYGDIGARFVKTGMDYVVKNTDPFYKMQMLKVGDKVVKINGMKVTSMKQLNQAILFAKLKSKINLEINRAGKIIKIGLMVSNRNGGGYLSDSFLEKKGIYFNDTMKINKIKKDSFGFQNGLKIGDKLIYIDKHKILNQNDLKIYLSTNNNKEKHLLFERNGFQFFVKLITNN